jgi:hypothetical protein
MNHEETPALTPDRQALVDELDRLEGELRRLVEPASDAAFRWRPDGGKAWSIGLCVEHLAVTNEAYVERLTEAVTRDGGRAGAPRGALAPSWFGRIFLSQLEPPPRYRVPAPKKIQPEEAHLGDRDGVWQRFAASQERVRVLIRSTADTAVDRVRFRNPFVRDLRVFTVADGFHIVAAHERRHLYQAKNVAARPDFPKG